MPITSIDRYFVGDPNIVGIVTTDDLATITATDYWKTQIPVVSQLINGAFEWSTTDLILIYYASNQIGFFTYNSTNLTFVQNGGSSGNYVSLAPSANQIIAGAYSLGANNLLPGYLEVPVTFGSYSLTAASPQILNFTGAFGGYDIVMPDVTTLTSITTNTTPYTLTNNTPSPAFVKSFDGAAIADIPAEGSINLYLKSNTDNTAAGWNIFGGGSPVVLNPTANQIILGAYGLYLDGGSFIAGTLAGAQFSRPGNVQSIGDASAAQFLATGYNNNGTSYLSYVTSEAIGASSVPLPDNAPLGMLEFAGDDGSGDGGPVSVKLDLKCAGTSSLGIVPSQATFSTSNQSNGLQPVWLADNTQNFNLYQGLTVVRGGLIGGTTGMYAFGASGQFEAISGTSGGQIISSGFNSTEPGFINTCSNTSVLGTYVPVTPDQGLGYWAAQGDDGFSYSAIAGYAEWTVDTGAVISQNVVPGRFTLYTTNSSGSPTPTFYADSLQNFVLPQGILEIGTPLGALNPRVTLYSTDAASGSFSIFSNNNAGDFANFLTHEITSDVRSWYLPDASGTIVLQGQAFSTFQINDLNDNPSMAITATANAENYIRLTNNITGNPPYIIAEGSDPNINLGLQSKGNGAIVINSLATVNQIVFNTGTDYQHATNLTFANTAQNRDVLFQDADGVLVMDTSNSGAGSGSITTAPPASSTASLSLGSAYQNTAGYDVVVTVYLSVTAATTADILSGVGPTNTPTQQTIVSGLTVAALTIVPVTLYIPAGYYALLSTSGTITRTISGQQTMAV